MNSFEKYADLLRESRYRHPDGTLLERNTRVRWVEKPTVNRIAIRLHATDIITYHSNGDIELFYGHWPTTVTLDRMNKFCPYQVHADGMRTGENAWYVYTGPFKNRWDGRAERYTFPFDGRMLIYKDKRRNPIRIVRGLHSETLQSRQAINRAEDKQSARARRRIEKESDNRQRAKKYGDWLVKNVLVTAGLGDWMQQYREMVMRVAEISITERVHKEIMDRLPPEQQAIVRSYNEPLRRVIELTDD